MKTRFYRFASASLMALALLLFPLGQTIEASPAESCVSACACCCLVEMSASSTPSCCGVDTTTEHAPAQSGQDGCTDSCQTCLCLATPAAPTLALTPMPRLAQPAWQDFTFAAILPDAAAPRAETPPVPPPRLS